MRAPTRSEKRNGAKSKRNKVTKIKNSLCTRKGWNSRLCDSSRTVTFTNDRRTTLVT
jgi:hypothetical protein